ncbi:MAG: ABC transporter ATP-binding protein [Clostridiales bacterium]|nr:ABC transporter ATP-binding protein [Clostridiales bacterium]MDY6067457.1 ABC transporter ATP-binding protein [Candidatus Faecousia sp.]
MSLLEVKDLKTYFYTDSGVAKAVDGVTFSLDKGKTLGIVGESGCGKSVTSLSIMRLVDPATGRNEGGSIVFDGQDLLTLPEKEMRKLRGNRISMIFQEPMTSLNPVFTIGDQISESLKLHKGLDKKAARDRAIELLELVGIPEAGKRVDEYPHQLSGGMRQRVMIAMALSGDPELLIADEPTTALDVTIQAQILQLLKDLQEKLHMSIIIITHDLGVIAEMADEVAVMYAGDIVEKAPTRALFDDPKHPYTIGLMNSIPDINDHVSRLRTLEGLVPSLYDMPSGCRFAPRCQFCCPECEAHRINLTTLPDGRQVRCRRFEA